MLRRSPAERRAAIPLAAASSTTRRRRRWLAARPSWSQSVVPDSRGPTFPARSRPDRRVPGGSRGWARRTAGTCPRRNESRPPRCSRGRVALSRPLAVAPGAAWCCRGSRYRPGALATGLRPWCARPAGPPWRTAVRDSPRLRTRGAGSGTQRRWPPAWRSRRRRGHGRPSAPA